MPEGFSPSALASYGGCRLKLVIASLPRAAWSERLASGPDAAVGTLLHRVLERSGRRSTLSADQIFREEYERTVEEMRRDPNRAHFADLAATKSLSEWTRLKSWVLARAARQESTHASREVGPFTDHLTASADPVTGPEINLESRALRLRGRADRIRQLGVRMFEVRDFKTGATVDEHGEIKPEIALQLQAYGLMLMERLPNAQVRLVVDDGEEREVPFDLETRRATRDALERFASSMPPPGRSSAVELASSGQACLGCQVRHVCPVYRTNAPTWWKQYPSEIERLPSDVWGVASEIRGDTRIDLVLRDDAARRVRIDGLDGRHGIGHAVVGSRIWFFGLEATGATRAFDGSRFHPRSFHELPRDRLERRAWTPQVFVDTETRR